MRPDRSHVNVKYRPEIDGLRALAVLPVIFFHAGFGAFQGGFVGVDVFFVISGYLITSIIVNDCRAGVFSLATFYERRARRILPALFVVLAACIPFVWAWMLPIETLSFSRNGLAAIAFVPNFYSWLTTSYFGIAAERLPLLHTWSLGVEEQFYVLFPLIIWFAWRFGLRVVVAVTVVLACLSFGLSEWAWRAGKFSSSFFLAPTRAWELMIGALLALAWQSRPIYERLGTALSNVGALTGIGLLAWSVFFFTKATPTPSVYALMPTVGAGLVIACAGPRTLVHKLLASPPLVGIGLISYSAYLWHQPLFAFARLRDSVEATWQLSCMLCVLALVLAYLTWRYVENPFRRASVIPRAVLVSSALSCWLVLAGLAGASELTKGFNQRIPSGDLALAALADTDAQGRYVIARFAALNRDFPSGTRATKVLVIGDSFAEDFINTVFESGNLSGAEIRTVSLGVECQPYLGERDVSEFIPPAMRMECALARRSPVLQRRVAEADVVVLAASWRPWAAQRLSETLDRLGQGSKRRIFVVGPKLVGDFGIRELLRTPTAVRIQESQPVAASIVDLERALSAVVPQGTYVSMQAAVCGLGPACKLFTPGGDLISFDGRHLTQAGAAYAGRKLFATPPLSAFAAQLK